MVVVTESEQRRSRNIALDNGTVLLNGNWKINGRLELALKKMIPISSLNEQYVIFEEYSMHVSHFSIEINRLICSESVSDENVVKLLKLLAGLYALLRTTLLNSELYSELVEKVENIELSAGKYLQQWTLNLLNSDIRERAGEIFELAWFCEDAISRSHLITFLYSHLDAERIGRNPVAIEETFSCLKSVLHPQKGTFLISKFHRALFDCFCVDVKVDDCNDDEIESNFYHNTDINDKNNNLLILKYSIESFNSMLKHFVNWSASVREISEEELTSLYKRSFHSLFKRVSAKLLSFENEASEKFLQTVIGEIINCQDGYLQFLIFTSITEEFNEMILLKSISFLINSTSQFSINVNITQLLENLIQKSITATVTSSCGSGGSEEESYNFFEMIWIEMTELIRSRAEIDQKDTVELCFLMIKLAAESILKNFQSSSTVKLKTSVEKILKFLSRTLKVEKRTFYGEESETGVALIKLINYIFDTFTVFCFNMENTLPAVIDCLNGSISRRICINQLKKATIPLQREHNNLTISVHLEKDKLIMIKSFFSTFTTICKVDLVQLLDSCNLIDDSKDQFRTALSSISDDLHEFSRILSAHFGGSLEEINEILNYSSSPSHTINLLLYPLLIERIFSIEGDDINKKDKSHVIVLLKKLINGIQSNTSTVLQVVGSRIEAEEEESCSIIESIFSKTTLGAAFNNTIWIHPEYPKLLAIKLNLSVAHNCVYAAYDFISQALQILNSVTFISVSRSTRVTGASDDQLKMEIITKIISALNSETSSKGSMSGPDFILICDALLGQISQVFNKSNRCELVIKLLVQVNGCRDCRDDSLGIKLKLLTQFYNLINQICEEDQKAGLSLSLLQLEEEVIEVEDDCYTGRDGLNDQEHQDNPDSSSRMLIQKIREIKCKIFQSINEDFITGGSDLISFGILKMKYNQDYNNNKIEYGNQEQQSIKDFDTYSYNIPSVQYAYYGVNNDDVTPNHEQEQEKEVEKMNKDKEGLDLAGDDLNRLKIFESLPRLEEGEF